MPTAPSGDDHPTPAMTDQEDDLRDTIAQARRGDLVAFNILVERYQQAAFGVAWRILGDAEEAADVTQEAILAAYRGMARFRGGAFRVWLLRIVTNRCLDYLRKRKRHPTTSLDALLAPGASDGGHAGAATSVAVALIDDAWDPVAIAEQHELQAYLQQGLLGLPEEQRVAVVLSDVEGLSYEEIATVTQANLGTVKSRIARARVRLREYLSQHQELLPREYRQSSRTDPPAPAEQESSRPPRLG